MEFETKDLGDSLTISFELVLPTLLGAFLGYKADEKMGTFPVAMVSGLFLGAAAGFFRVVGKFLKEKR